MGMLTRIKRILGANLDDAIRRAENPAKLLNYLVLEMQDNLDSARSEVASAMAAEARLSRQYDQAHATAVRWEQRARLALEGGQEELAREALRRKIAAMELATYYEQAREQQAEAVAQLRMSLSRLETRLREAKAQRVRLLAQLDASRAQQFVARSLRQTMGEDSFDTFDRIASQIVTEQARAQSLADLTRDDLEEGFLVAESHAAVETEISAMKRELTYREADTPRAITQDESP